MRHCPSLAVALSLTACEHTGAVDTPTLPAPAAEPLEVSSRSAVAETAPPVELSSRSIVADTAPPQPAVAARPRPTVPLPLEEPRPFAGVMRAYPKWRDERVKLRITKRTTAQSELHVLDERSDAGERADLPSDRSATTAPAAPHADTRSDRSTTTAPAAPHADTRPDRGTTTAPAAPHADTRPDRSATTAPAAPYVQRP